MQLITIFLIASILTLRVSISLTILSALSFIALYKLLKLLYKWANIYC